MTVKSDTTVKSDLWAEGRGIVTGANQWSRVTGREDAPIPRHPTERGRLRIGVIGARGGAGASVFAASLAHELARTARSQVPSTPAALVDLDLGGGGLDVVLGIEEFPGLRWADLGDARGDVPGIELLELMPRWGEVAVLSSDRGRPVTHDRQVGVAVLSALAGSTDLVLDLPRGIWSGAGQSDGLASFVLDLCDLIFLVVPRDLASVAGAQAVLAGLSSRVEAPGGARQVALIVRGPAPGGLDPAQICRVLGAPLASQMGPERALAAAIERGVGPLGPRLRLGAREALEYARGRHTLRGRR